jgi:hypothetical protein
VQAILKALFPRRPMGLQWQHGFIAAWAIIAAAVAAFCYSPGQDHFGAISLHGDGRWYANYVLSKQQILDPDVFFHGVGRSIENARSADIVFLGTSRTLFGLDRRLFDGFTERHRVKMFNMAFAGIMSGEFSLILVHKWNIRPRLWVIDLYGGPPDDFASSFFNVASSRRLMFETTTLAVSNRYEGHGRVMLRDLDWRAKMLMRSITPSTYRSSETGNWYLDNWPMYQRPDLPKMTETGEGICHVERKEVDAARVFIHELGDVPVVLTESPSKFACLPRAQELAGALGVPLFAPSPNGYSTTDGGGHLGAISAAKYSALLFAWLEQSPAFREMVERKVSRQ